MRPAGDSEQMEEHDRVESEEHRDHDGQPGQVPLHDVRSALRMRREAEAPHTRLASGVHEDERDHHRCDQHLEDG
jgi:hypothetical protein